MRRGLRSRKTTAPVRPRRKIRLDDVVHELTAEGRPCDTEFLREVYDFSAEMHGDQTRQSGEPYLSHPLYVAYLLAGFRADQTSVAVGLLHDVLEDTLTTRETIAERFGDDVAALVDGVTKIGRHEYTRRDEAQAETFRKLILASVKDIRVILVKLADRLHNMMTLEPMEPEARRRISRETLAIYAPIAHRLGMSKVQGDLLDLSFYYLYPLQFAELERKVAEKLKASKAATHHIRERLGAELDKAGIKAEISFRVKRLYSIHQKLRRQGIEIAQLYDYLAYRIVTDEIRDCYAALGVVHQNWRPVPGRFKDYIAMPKPNLYQSLHTTLVGNSGQPFEVQIRTRDMDLVAEEGIAAHWGYKEGREKADAADPDIAWLRQVLDWQQEVNDPRTFMSTLKVDLYPDEVYVFSPKGDVLSFPRGATPLDFAYRVHTELGHHCSGARINGRLVPLRTELKNGDMIEILTNASRQPSRDWLSIVSTSRAKSKIRQWLNTEQKRQALEIGRRLLERELKKYRVAPKRFYASEAFAKYLSGEGIASAEDLLSQVGFGKIAVRPLLDRTLSEDELSTSADQPSKLRQAMNRILPFSGDTAVTVRGDSDLLAYLAKCCNPLPGDEIVGYVTRGKGVSVHSAECSNVGNLLYNPDREIQVEWARTNDEVFPISLAIETEDQPGILARLTETIAKHGGNIRHFEAETMEAARGLIEVVVEVTDRRQLEKMREGLQAVDGVLRVSRLRGGRESEFRSRRGRP
ncbi:MAG: bifunctional (p)ppGpp synthetase/guanosine-3',5'-bis(diphosphate) 3'-pyrophosphohydrolase [Acidobacteriota bacterium]|nr:bifunctional (p)ppGpp synthetase/guanosine-3',5'-bis(diphosphate) 3'-pyrophosphohydrolase [Acidobacteriota bacterium]